MKVIKAEYKDTSLFYVCAPHGVVLFDSVSTVRLALQFSPTLSAYPGMGDVGVYPNKSSILKWIKPRKAKVSVFHV